MNMHKSLVGVAAASALFVVSSMAHADGSATPAQSPTQQAAATAAPVAPATTSEGEHAPVVAKRSVLPIVTMAVGGTAMLVGIACLSVAGTQKQEAESNDSLNREYGDYGVNLDTKKLNDQSASSTKTGTLLIAGGAVVAVGGADRGARAPTSKARSE